MVNISLIIDKDPTLEAADAALVAASELEPPRPYLGMSSIGENCSRKLWYRFRWAKRERFDADTLKRFADGHAGEDVIVERLKRVMGVQMSHTGKVQKTYTDIDGHFSGHPDGIIAGLAQAPKTPHIFEAKVCGDKKINELRKAKLECGEKLALKKWNPTYYAQAILYMYYEGLARHYLVAASAGVRNWISVRAESCDKTAKILIEKARRIIFAQNPPEGVSEDETWWECHSCSFAGICHQGEMPDRNCRTCAHSTPAEKGKWKCALGKMDGCCGTVDSSGKLVVCDKHVFIPALVPGEIIASTETSVTYKMKSGEVWKDGKA